MTNETIYPFGQGGQLPSGYPIADDLDTESATQALSAKQGVKLKKMISEGLLVFDLSVLKNNVYTGLYINSSTNQWTISAQGTTDSFFVDIEPGKKYRITGNITYTSRMAILKSDSHAEGDTPDYATGEDAMHILDAGETYEFTAPEDATVLNINRKLSGNTVTPSSLVEIVDKDTLVAPSSLSDKVNRLLGNIDEQVVFDDLTVLSNDTTKITITKNDDGTVTVYNKAKTTSKYALLGLPDTLEPGVKYRLSFDFVSAFYYADNWYWGIVGSDYQPTSGGVYIPKNSTGHIDYDFVFKPGDLYLRLASSSQNTGATVKFSNISISRYSSSIAELAKAVENIGGNSDIDTAIEQARYIATEPTVSPLVFLHFTDIHADTYAAAAITEFYEKHSDVIDDMVLTGDVVKNYVASDATGYPWFENNGMGKALFVIGNHDGSSDSNTHGWKEGGADWDFKGREWDFDTYFADYITERGVTPPEGYDDPTSEYYKALYWHKDYSSAKVRVIGLDCMHFNDGVRYTDTDQETWLAAKLQETLTSGNDAYGYSVVFLCHYPIDDFNGDNETWDESTHKFVYNQNENGGGLMDNNTGRIVNFLDGNSYEAQARFSLRNRVGTQGSTSYSKGQNNPLADIIQTWIGNGGKFVVWLSGHTHTEYMYYPAKYPSMLCVGLPQAGNTKGTTYGDRNDNSPMHSAANICVIDTENKLFKVIRFGKTMDKFLKSLTTICYNYDTHEVSRH